MYSFADDNVYFEDIEDTETEFARLLNEETEAEKSEDSRLKRSNRGAENLDIEEDYIPIVAKKEPVVESTVEKVPSSEYFDSRNIVC